MTPALPPDPNQQLPFAPLAASGNPTLAPLADLPPDTQNAVKNHLDRLLATPTGSPAQPSPTLTPMGAAEQPGPDDIAQLKAMRPLPVPATTAKPLAPTPTANQVERTRLTDPTLQSSKPGWQQIHNPILRTLAGIGNVAESTFFPGAAMLTPGTDLHHAMLVRQNARENAVDEAEQSEASKRKLEEAQTENQQSEAANRKNAAEVPHTLATAAGIMQWNPETKRFDIPAGQSPEKEETEGKTVTTDQGVMQWNPKTKTYDIRVGGTPEKEAEKTIQDADGVWYHLGKDNTATPITLNGKPFQGKATEKGENAEQQFVDEYRKANPKATVADAQRAFKQNEHIAPDRDPTAALDRETTRFAKPHEKSVADATAQLEKIADARAMINGNAESQALGIPKVLTALVSGQGSGVRITQPELNAIATARGIKGDFQGWLNSVSGKGKLTNEQKAQLSTILNDVENRVRQKQAIANDALDKINGARSREEIIQHDKDARRALADLEKSAGTGKETTKEEYDKLPVGATYTKGGQQFVKR